MAAYVKQQDQIVLILSKAEASALNDRILHTQDGWEVAAEAFPQNGMKASALDRAHRALSVACEPGSRACVASPENPGATYDQPR